MRPIYHRSDAAAHASVLDASGSELAAGGGCVATVFHGLQGRWTFDRDLRSRLTSQPSARVRGIARFEAADGGRAYEYGEIGEVLIGDARHVGTQQYRFELNEANHTIDVRFRRGPDAGKPFHAMVFAASAERPALGPASAPRRWQAHGHHVCGQDEYGVAYAFELSGARLDSFSMTYRVRGPHKDYTSFTAFRRLST